MLACLQPVLQNAGYRASSDNNIACHAKSHQGDGGPNQTG